MTPAEEKQKIVDYIIRNTDVFAVTYASVGIYWNIRNTMHDNAGFMFVPDKRLLRSYGENKYALTIKQNAALLEFCNAKTEEDGA